MARAARKAGPARKQAATTGITRETPLLEWLSAGVGLVLILLVVAVLGFEVLRGDDSEPRFTVETLSVAQSGSGYLMTVRVRNDGGSPAAAVVVEGQLEAAGEEPETAEATFDFVADHSVREGGLFFKRDPRRGQVSVEAKSYVDP